tara:strand:+ start:72 stop:452 length:381 start_codon:yes stop_codon:yes gene_type:complete
MKKIIYFAFGVFFFGLGIFGYYMPLFPGTVFLIIAAYFFMNSSEKFYSKITNNRFYGNSVKVYIEQNKIPLKAKIIILISIWIATSLSIFITPKMNFNIFGTIFNFKIVLVVLSLIGSFFVLKSKH